MDSVLCLFHGVFKVGQGLQLLPAFTESSGNDHSQGLPCFNRKRLEKSRVGKFQPLQPKQAGACGEVRTTTDVS